MKIKRMTFPIASLLFTERKNYNYSDSFGCTFVDPKNKINIETIVNDFSKPLPVWIDALMSVRDKIVSVIGLKTSEEERNTVQRGPYKLVEGEKIGFFNLYNRTNNEVILGEDDKHLDFRVSLLLENPDQDSGVKKIIITTVVTYNNWMGRIYFFFIKPFHRLVVRDMMKKNYNY